VFTVPFPYLAKAHTQVFFDGVLQSASTYTWPSSGTISFVAGPPAAGIVVERRRVTPRDTLVTFAAGALDAKDLNSGHLQNLYLAQEAQDLADDNKLRGWFTSNYGSTGFITKGGLGVTVKFDALGNLIPGTVDLDTLQAVTLAARDVAVQAAADAYVAGLNAVGTIPADTRTAMKALVTTVKKGALLREAGREGLFHFVDGDKTADVAADPGEGVWVAQTPTIGAWRRTEVKKVSPKMWGAVRGNGSNYDPANPTLYSSKLAIQRCWDWAAANRAKVIMDDEFHGGGHLNMPSFLHCEWEQGAWLYQTEKSVYGGFVMNRSTDTSLSRYRENVILENAQIDGQYALAPRTFTVASSTSPTVFTLDASAPATDGALNGLALQLVDGTAGINGLSLGTVLSYVGATRQVTMAAALNLTPAIGTTLLVGWNDLGIGFGCYNSHIDGFNIKNYAFKDHIYLVNGAKAINVEQGTYGTTIRNGIIHNCGFGIYLQGISFESAANPEFIRAYPTSGTAVINTVTANSCRLPAGASSVNNIFRGYVCYFYPTGDLNFKATERRTIASYNGTTKEMVFDYALPAAVNSSWTVVVALSKRNGQLIFEDIKVSKTGVAIAALGGEPFHDPEPFDNLHIITNIVAENCGYAPFRVVGSAAVKQKSGVICLTGTANCLISNVNIYNDTFYPSVDPGWAGLYPTFLGSGLSGNSGAVVWGTARNTTLQGIHAHGDFDCLVHLARGQAVGRDGTPTGALRFNIDGLYHYGTCNYVFETGNAAPTDPNLSGRWTVYPGTVATGFTDGTGLGYQSVQIALIDPLSHRSVRGKMVDINRVGSFANTTAFEYTVGQPVASSWFETEMFTLADDTVKVITPPSTYSPTRLRCHMRLTCHGFEAGDGFAMRNDGTPTCVKTDAAGAASNNCTASTAVLTGTTGTDGKINVSAANNGFIYIENRSGASNTFSVVFS
jgi:hypothetical protein